ncbi:hypothetical protein [Propionivibrio sp.]|uniref:hypothetical protein n=1 Tax=Propionivibrio sp. TaxID=2212460 RepID=UPI003BF22F71
MKSHTLSLSRWHKVAERLSRSYTEITQAARNTFINTQVNGFLGEAQVARLRDEAALQMIRLHRAFTLQDALANIRQAVGEANAKTGVSKELANYDALSRRHKYLESILAAQSSEMVNFDEMPQLPKQLVSEDRYDRSKGSVRVRMLDNEMVNSLRVEADELRIKVYALADRISDLNRERLSLDLSEDIAQAAGL